MLQNIFAFHKQKGSATLSVLMTVVILVGCTAAGFLVTIRRQHEVRNEQWRQQAYYIAESSVSAAISQINGVIKDKAIEPPEGAGNIGTADKPESLAGGTFYTTTLGKQGAKKNVWVVTANCDHKDYAGKLVATLRSAQKPLLGAGAGLSAGDKGVELMSNTFIDSYDSSKASYPTTKGAKGYANQNGDIASNHNITLNANTGIYGNAQAAPGYKTIIANNSEVTGITTNLSKPLTFDAVKLPTEITSPNNTYSPGRGDHTILSGDYKYTSFTLASNSSVTIKAPARIYIDGTLTLNSNTKLIVDNTNAGGVIIYITKQFIMSSQTGISHINNPRGWPEPGNFRVECTYTTTNFTKESDSAVNLKSNTGFIGSVYAPNGTVLVNANADFFGAFAGKEVELDSNARVHYDEALKNKPDPNDSTAGELSLMKWDWTLNKK